MQFVCILLATYLLAVAVVEVASVALVEVPLLLTHYLP
jgi:hypothetical protein